MPFSFIKYSGNPLKCILIIPLSSDKVNIVSQKSYKNTEYFLYKLCKLTVSRHFFWEIGDYSVEKAHISLLSVAITGESASKTAVFRPVMRNTSVSV